MLVVWNVQGIAAPYLCCATCGEPVVARGLYGWRWPVAPCEGPGHHHPPGQTAPVSIFHKACAPKTTGKKGDWEFAALEKLPGYLAHNFESWTLKKLPPAGLPKAPPPSVKAPPPGYAEKVLAKKAKPPAKRLLRVLKALDAPKPLPPEPQKAKPAEPPPSPKPKALRVMPCVERVDMPWGGVDACMQPSVPGEVYCPPHFAVYRQFQAEVQKMLRKGAAE